MLHLVRLIVDRSPFRGVHDFNLTPKRIVGVAQVDTTDRRDRGVYGWLQRRPHRRATVRDLQHNGVASIKKAGQARLVMQSLVDRGWVRWSDDGQGSIEIPGEPPDPADNPTDGT